MLRTSPFSPTPTRKELFATLHSIIEKDYAGYVERPYRFILFMAQKKESLNESQVAAI